MIILLNPKLQKEKLLINASEIYLKKIIDKVNLAVKFVIKLLKARLNLINDVYS